MSPIDADDIVDYYHGAWFDYRVIWVRNRCMHFGYWDAGTRGHADSLLAMSRILAREAGLEAGEQVLDAGCGVGGPALLMAREYGAEVTGITLSDRQVTQARERAEQSGLDGRVTFERQDFTDLPYPDNSFDVVWAQESVCHVPNDRKQVFVREAHRVLRPGGRLVMEDWFRTRRPLDRPDERLLHRWLDSWVVADLATTDEMVGWAAEAGFTGIGHRDLTVGARRSLRRLYAYAVALYPLGLLLRVVGVRSRVAHRNLQGARLQWRAHRRGLWSIRVLWARKPT